MSLITNRETDSDPQYTELPSRHVRASHWTQRARIEYQDSNHGRWRFDIAPNPPSDADNGLIGNVTGLLGAVGQGRRDV